MPAVGGQFSHLVAATYPHLSRLPPARGPSATRPRGAARRRLSVRPSSTVRVGTCPDYRCACPHPSHRSPFHVCPHPLSSFSVRCLASSSTRLLSSSAFLPSICPLLDAAAAAARR